MGTLLLLMAVPATFAILYLLYSYAYAPFQVLSEFGIPGPRPLPFFGNYFSTLRVGWSRMPGKLCKTYGPVFGYYTGPHVFVVVADVEMLKTILVKESDSFLNRGALPDFVFKAIGMPPGLFLDSGQQWKRARQILSPAFSTMKLRMVAPLVNERCDTLVENLGNHANSGRSIDITKIYSSFTMETILAALFGQLVELQRGEGETIVKATSVLFEFAHENIVMHLFFTLGHFPFLELFFGWAMRHSWRGKYFKLLYETVKHIVKERRQATTTAKHKDLLQLMLDVSVEGRNDGTEGNLTDEDIVSHAMTFLLAGYETTSNALGYTSYLLALNPSVQEKLHWEIEQYFERKPSASLYDAAQEVEYVDMVLQESLRIFPPAPGTARVCTKTTDIGGGVTIQEGMHIQVPILFLHHSPEFWKDPEKFDPERFTAEEKAKRPSICHMPFGWGPRNCIGSRFGLIELRMAVVTILRRYKFLQAPDTEIPLQTENRLAMAPKNGIYLEVSTWEQD